MNERVEFEAHLGDRRFRFYPDRTAPGRWIAETPEDPFLLEPAARYGFRCGGVRVPSRAEVLERFTDLHGMLVETEEPPIEDHSWLYEDVSLENKYWRTP
jgi:hypothetical protein